jgi:CarboxypepD_reg-like domain
MRIPSRILRIVLLLVATATALQAQWTISGRIIDADAQDPLPGALALLAGETRGAVADSTGRFVLSSKIPYPVINIQYLGYKPISKRLDLKKEQKYEFAMLPDPLTLPTTTIIADGLQRVHPDRTTSVIDYEFLHGQLLLLVYDRLRKRNVIQLFSRDLNLLAEADVPDRNLRALMADCVGNCHCTSDDFVGQIDFAKGHLFVRWDSLSVFNRVVATCQARLASTYYFAFQPHNFAKAFMYQHEGATKRKFLYGTIDQKTLDIIHDEGLAEVRDGTKADLSIASPYGSTESLRAVFQTELNRQYLSLVVCPPIYVPIKIAHQSVLIFDHPHDLVLRYDELGYCLDTIRIDYHHLPNWKKEVIVDDEAQEVYTMTELGGYTRLHRIDLRTGTLAESWELPDPFPLKIKVMGGFIYYTYRDNATDATKRLYRMQL